jgi:polyphosphate kinase
MSNASLAADPGPDLDPRLYLNRELSLLEFQHRVLEEAADQDNPLLERVKFLAVFGSNMDEFFMVRVSGIRRQVEARIATISPDGLTPRQELAAIRKRAAELQEQAQRLLRRKVLPKLDKAGVHVLSYRKLTKSQKARADRYFRDEIYPVLTPLALDSGHPFPHISNLSLNLVAVIREPDGTERFARLKVPDTLPRLVPLKRASGATRRDGTVPHHHYFAWLEEVIAGNMGMLFPGMEVPATHLFRVVRDADMEIQQIEADDLLETMQQTVRRRKFGSVVQLAIYDTMPEQVRSLLIKNLEIKPGDMEVQAGPLGLGGLSNLYDSVERHDLTYPRFKPRMPTQFQDLAAPEEIFSAIRQEDILLHHPYDSFQAVVDYLVAAARDPHVLAIKQTLYRVGANSPVVDALLEATERGKQVAALVELKARFDEESNIGWARKLERAGVHVVYGFVGLKTHCKIGLVVRREGNRIRRYVHLATGNYNPTTARVYEDIGIFTCNDDLGADGTDLFNYLTGYSMQPQYRKLIVAPVNLRQSLEALILRATQAARDGKPARLIFKANGLSDPHMIQHLYAASQAGVNIDLLIRGICSLRPGVKGASENIRVRSTLGRYLEHSRIYYASIDGRESVHLGSADLMQRNLDHRVELLFPVEAASQIRYLRDHVLEAYLHDSRSARSMRPDGTYERLRPKEADKTLSVQDWLMTTPWHGQG